MTIKLEGCVNAVAFSSDGRKIASGSDAVRLWDVSTGEQLRLLDGHTDRVTSVAFSDDDSRIVSGSWDKSVRDGIHRRENSCKCSKATPNGLFQLYF